MNDIPSTTLLNTRSNSIIDLSSDKSKTKENFIEKSTADSRLNKESKNIVE